jgi:hypothetical protein
MEDIFRSYWWLLFPLGWFVVEGWQSWLRYRARRDALRLVQTYAEKGQTPPDELVKAITGENIGSALGIDGAEGRPSTTNWGWYQVALFGALAGGFVFLSRSGLIGDGDFSRVLLVAAVILGALGLASLVYALSWKGPRG